MNVTMLFLGGLGLGWGLSQLLDSSRGRRRRAMLRDKAVSAAHVVADALEATTRDVSNRTRGAVAELRGGRWRGSERFELLQSQWSPTARLLMGLAAATATVAGLRRRGLTGALTGAGGLGVLARALTNRELTKLFGIGGEGWAVTVQKTITVAAPIEEVFELWSRYEDFPRFMAHVYDVRRIGANRARWTVAGPAGIPIVWETEETRREPPRLLAWTTTEDSPIAHEGVVRFDESPEGTRVHLRMHYNPPAGVVGHALAGVLGVDPKQALDEDLIRFKSLLEDGKTSVAGKTISREALG